MVYSEVTYEQKLGRVTNRRSVVLTFGAMLLFVIAQNDIKGITYRTYIT
jgi:hypothetical protein